MPNPLKAIGRCFAGDQKQRPPRAVAPTQALARVEPAATVRRWEVAQQQLEWPVFGVRLRQPVAAVLSSATACTSKAYVRDNALIARRISASSSMGNARRDNTSDGGQDGMWRTSSRVIESAGGGPTEVALGGHATGSYRRNGVAPSARDWTWTG